MSFRLDGMLRSVRGALRTQGRYLLISGHNSNQRNDIILQSIKSDQLLLVVNSDGCPGWCWSTEYNGSPSPPRRPGRGCDDDNDDTRTFC